MDARLKVVKRESLVLLGFTVVWVLTFLLRNLWDVIYAFNSIVIYAYVAHLVTKIALFILRTRGKAFY